MLAVAVVSSGDCLTAAQKTPEQHACCLAMKGECEMAVSASCCATGETESHGLVAIKATPTVPVAVLVAILTVPPVAASANSHVVSVSDASSAGPPGVPTYLFVSSYRI